MFSSCSTCKVCKAKIDKDVLRVGTTTDGAGDYLMTSWRHLECQKKPKAMTDLSALAGLTSLTAEDQAKVETWFVAAAAPAKKSTGKRSADAPPDGSSGGEIGEIGDPKKMKAAEVKKALEANGLPTTGKKAEQVAALQEVTKRQSLDAKYAALSTEKLKAMLALNAQVKSGDKQTLVDRCVDGAMYGALPRCSDCGGGTLRVQYLTKFGHGGEGKFSCPGYYDDDAYRRCSFSATSVERPAWKEE